MRTNKAVQATGFFWRTTQQQEIEYIVEQRQDLLACEFKWNPKRKNARFPKTFLKGYPEARTRVITPADHDLFLTDPQL